MAIIQIQVLSFHRKIVRPYLESGQSFAERHPVISLFISVFSILSFIPVVTFIGFSLLVTLSFVSIGVTCALIASSALISGAAVILFISLGIIFLTSIFFSASILAFFALFKVSQQIAGGHGVKFNPGQETNGPLKWLSISQGGGDKIQATVSGGSEDMNTEDPRMDS